MKGHADRNRRNRDDQAADHVRQIMTADDRRREQGGRVDREQRPTHSPERPDGPATDKRGGTVQAWEADDARSTANGAQQAAAQASQVGFPAFAGQGEVFEHPDLVQGDMTCSPGGARREQGEQCDRNDGRHQHRKEVLFYARRPIGCDQNGDGHARDRIGERIGGQDQPGGPFMTSVETGIGAPLIAKGTIHGEKHCVGKGTAIGRGRVSRDHPGRPEQHKIMIVEREAGQPAHTPEMPKHDGSDNRRNTDGQIGHETRVQDQPGARERCARNDHGNNKR